MKIVVRRFEYGDKFTIGKMYINDSTEFECYTLEDKVRPKGVKVQNETAIPSGVYNLVINYSQHFDRILPQLLNVPMFEGVRIHSGNTDLDTEGCILVGSAWPGGDMILQSRDAFNKLFPKIQAAWNAKETITVEVIDTK